MATALAENTIATLKVLRQSEQGAFLDGGTGNTNDDILLHRDQQTTPVTIGDEVTVFLYKDPKGRMTASMRLPAMSVGQIGYVEVINRTSFGCFVEVGTERGIFMPHAEMRGRPQVGEKVWVRLYEDKSGRLAVSMDVDDGVGTLTANMSVALVTTFYGCVLANVILLPIAKKLRIRNEEELLYCQIIVEGVLSIQSGDNPKFLKEKLTSYLAKKHQKKLLKEAK